MAVPAVLLLPPPALPLPLPSPPPPRAAAASCAAGLGSNNERVCTNCDETIDVHIETPMGTLSPSFVWREIKDLGRRRHKLRRTAGGLHFWGGELRYKEEPPVVTEIGT
jgi:hypothetical protein